ncbi:MAG: peptide chain release factor 3 [Vicinamibacterales bacterium]
MSSDASLDNPPGLDPRLAAEIGRRRTFAIISHPDAGKTTLTEKLLLYAGAIELAGAVRGRKTQRHVVSDWMDVERERGISVTSAALDFDLGECRVTLLDTPGHQDFSEDTYRTLFAVDSVIMVIDAAKGIETQTRKLFEVCRLRKLPILTFVNKLDLPGRDPFDLLEEIERILGIQTSPLNWPIGSGDRFRGVFDLVTKETRVYERVPGGGFRAPVHSTSATDPVLVDILGEQAREQLINDTELIAGAGNPFSREAYLAGEQTPVYFGSALDNFGMEALLDALQTLAPPPQARVTDGGVVSPLAPGFSGFVFKIQANMNRKHRDRVAFVRVCSGVFEKDMALVNARNGETVRAARPYRFFGGERETVERAYPGDVIGLPNPGKFAIGDTLYVGAPVSYPPVPRFPPEHFGRARLLDQRSKQFDVGVRQLEEEGLMQVVFPVHGRREPILGVVGPLQLDIVEARLKQEYGLECKIEPISYAAMRWVTADPQTLSDIENRSTGIMRAVDRHEQPVLLFETPWHLNYLQQQHPKLELKSVG